MYMYTSKYLLKCIHVHIVFCFNIHIINIYHQNVSISSINAESILQKVISSLKCLYFETFCRFPMEIFADSLKVLFIPLATSLCLFLSAILLCKLSFTYSYILYMP